MKVLIINTTYKQKGGEDTVLANETALLQSSNLYVRSLTFSNEGRTFAKFLQLPFNYGTFRDTLRVIDEFKPDVAHVHNLHFGGTASVLYALRRRKVPAVMTLHNYRLLCPSGTLFNDNRIFLDSINSIFPWEAIKEKVYLNSWFLTFWSSFSMMIHHGLGTWFIPAKYIVLGQNMKEVFSHSKLSSMVPRMIVKPNFCPPSNVKEVSRDYYLYLGRLSEEKGIDVLLNAFKENGLYLRVAGAGPLEDKIVEAAKSHKNIQFLGSVNPQKAASELKGAKALIFPSVWYETFGMTIIEAFAAGTPVIASFLGQLKITIDHEVNGLHFNAGDIADLNEKINYYDQLSTEDRMVYEKNAKLTYDLFFAPKANLKQLVNLYDEVITEKVIANSNTNIAQIEFNGYHLFGKDLRALPKSGKIVISTINQYSFCIAEEDREFKKALKQSDVLLPDGIGIVAGLKMTTGQHINKISGSELHFHLLENLNNTSGKCFYLGSTLKTLEKIKRRLRSEYPNIECHYYSPPFKPVFSEQENIEILNNINAIKPDVVFVGMTAPKQEKWVNTNKGAIDAQIICSIGAVFDFYAEVISRPSSFWINLGLEWFIRLCKEPRRMWKRYVLYGPIFVYALLKEKLKIDLSSNIIPKDSI